MAGRSTPLMDNAEFLQELGTLEDGLGARRATDGSARHNFAMIDPARREPSGDAEEVDETDEELPGTVSTTAFVAVVLASLIVGACAAALVLQDRVVALMR
jgi:hypothetical protein